MDRAMVADFLGRIAILVGTFVVIIKLPQDQRLLGAIGFVVIGNAINLFVNYFFVKKFVSFKPRFVFKEWPGIIVQVLPMAALAVLGMIHFKADSVLLTLYRPAVEVGIYGNAYKVLEILITLPGMFIGGLFPEMNQLIQKGKEHLIPLFQKAFDLLLFVVLPIVAGVVLVAPQLISILTRNFIPESAGSLQVLAFAMIPLYLGTLMTHTLLTVERQKSLTLVELAATVLNISLNIYLIPRYTYHGAAAATTFTEVLSTIVTTWLVSRAISYNPKLRTLWPSLAGVICMYFSYKLVQHLGDGAWDNAYYSWSRIGEVGALVTVIIVGTAAYLLPFIIFRCFPPVIQERLRNRTNG
jgi:O-antigen/teichoic acid export membrane protein